MAQKVSSPPFVVRARGPEALKNGSFHKVYRNGDVSTFINGDFMWIKKAAEQPQLPAELREYSWKEAREWLPPCCGGRG